jgi:hypothetical protein
MVTATMPMSPQLEEKLNTTPPHKKMLSAVSDTPKAALTMEYDYR